MAVSRMSEENLRKIAEKLESLLYDDGLNDTQACSSLGLHPRDFEIVRAKMLEIQRERLDAQTTEDLYLEYIRSQRKCISDLNKVIDRTLNSAKPSATTVNAIKARSDIYNKIIETGQHFGIIERKPDRKEIVQGVVVAHMEDNELKEAVLGQFKAIGAMIGKYSGSDGDFLDIDPGPIHFEEDKKDDKTQKKLPEPEEKPGVFYRPALEAPAEGVKKHARNKVHKGRRVTKGRKK